MEFKSPLLIEDVNAWKLKNMDSRVALCILVDKISELIEKHNLLVIELSTEENTKE